MKTPLQIVEAIISNVTRLGKLTHQAKSDWGLDVYELDDIVTVKSDNGGWYNFIENDKFCLEFTCLAPYKCERFVYKRGSEEDLIELWGLISEKLGLT